MLRPYGNRIKIIQRKEAIKKETEMNTSKCPHCGVKLGNFLYADACPRCHEELKHNTRPLILAQKKDAQESKPRRIQSFFARAFFGVVRFVES
jgi:hypothetical protein